MIFLLKKVLIIDAVVIVIKISQNNQELENTQMFIPTNSSYCGQYAIKNFNNLPNFSWLRAINGFIGYLANI